ncbi:unnamed protein product, partial [Mesorhabditis belari]|uniref:Uncharacterized protein n=1 Tax=Mesorhabditis belari TaxID=2138241 RepID=A0AAF3EQ94_9BILA
MQEQIQDKAGEQLQRLNWERLKKKIHGLVNKVNASNLVGIVRELLQENSTRGKGLLTGSMIQAQVFSPQTFHPVFRESHDFVFQIKLGLELNLNST